MTINRLYHVVPKFFSVKHILIGFALGLCLSTSVSAQEYQGYRVFVSNMSITKAKPGYTMVQTTIINTGREAFKLSPALTDKIIVKYDASLSKVLAQLDSLDVIHALLESGITLAPGKILANSELKVFPTPTKVIASNPKIKDNSTPTEVVSIDDQQVSMNKDKRTASTKTNKAKKKNEKTKDAKNEKQSEIEEPSLAASKVKKAKKGKKKKQKNTSTTAKEMAEAKAVKAIEKGNAKDQKEQQVAQETTKSKLANPNQVLEAETMPEEKEEEGCADLILEELSVLKKTKNSVQLAYTIRNIGQGRVFIGAKKKEEGIAIRGHLSSSEHLSRGALTVGGDFLAVDDSDAILSPGQSYSGSVKLPMYKLTKFTPYLILQIDPYQKILECDETNNLHYINLIPDSPMSKPADNQ